MHARIYIYMVNYIVYYGVIYVIFAKQFNSMMLFCFGSNKGAT